MTFYAFATRVMMTMPKIQVALDFSNAFAECAASMLLSFRWSCRLQLSIFIVVLIQLVSLFSSGWAHYGHQQRRQQQQVCDEITCTSSIRIHSSSSSSSFLLAPPAFGHRKLISIEKTRRLLSCLERRSNGHQMFDHLSLSVCPPGCLLDSTEAVFEINCSDNDKAIAINNPRQLLFHLFVESWPRPTEIDGRF